VGGDEFIILLGEMKSPDDCIDILDRLLEAVSQPVSIGNKTAHVTASIGVATFPHGANDAESLLKLADQAMYLAKDSGKSRYIFSRTVEN
jgi:diguanylate cyclase (GGDEF)-like protein